MIHLLEPSQMLVKRVFACQNMFSIQQPRNVLLVLETARTAPLTQMGHRRVLSQDVAKDMLANLTAPV
jgi:hypothetical protein